MYNDEIDRLKLNNNELTKNQNQKFNELKIKYEGILHLNDDKKE